MKVISLVVVVAVLVSYVAADSPMWKVFCLGNPLFRGMVDPIVNPGTLSLHSHRVNGASNFGFSSASTSPIDLYNQVVASNCTTCSISIDKSIYWHPDLYYRWPNGSLSLVPYGGLTVYYPSRPGYDDQSNPKWTAFPPGLRIVAGNPNRRTFDPNNVAHTAVSYACLADKYGEEVLGQFPTKNTFCNHGLRAQVWFPMCWDGKNLDSADHFSHMAYPVNGRADYGSCPSTHPVRIPGIFYEAIYYVDQFPHGQGTQPFVWSNGDTTGWSFHGDFLNGWDQKIVQAALEDPTCLAGNTDLGNQPKNCAPFAPYVKNGEADNSCGIQNKLNTIEDLGLNRLISHLPGCNALTGAGATVSGCTGSWPQAQIGNNLRVAITSAVNNKYWSITTEVDNLAASTPAGKLTYSEMFTIAPQAGTPFVAIKSESNLQFMSDNTQGATPFRFNRGAAQGWEYFTIKYIGGTGPSASGTAASILANSNGKYLTIMPDGTIQSAATSVTANSTFYISNPNVVADTRSSLANFDEPNNLENNIGESGATSIHAAAMLVVAVAAAILL